MQTPRDLRAAARNERQHHLQLPDHLLPLGRGNLDRSRSPSPSAPGNFVFPPPQLENLPQQFEDAETSNMAELAALTTALQGMKVSSRKPELPDFDSKNIDVWLKRVDNAYRRAGVTDPKDKFAFVEPKFAVDSDPRINELLFGEGTAEEWTAFESYLRGRYGRTKAQQAAAILDGTPRDGKLPSEMFAHIKEKIGTLTIDELVKEMVLRELPTDIRRTIHDKVKALDGAETMKIADEYFDKNGKPLHKSNNNPINAVNDVPDLIDTEDESDDVNAVSRRFNRMRPRQHRQQQGQPRSFPQKQQQTSRPNNPSFTPAFGERRVNTNTGKPTVKPANLCRWHKQFGKDAYTCEVGCDRFQGSNAGKAKAGRQA